MYKYRLPFEHFPQGAKLLICGGGNAGKEFVDQIKRTNYCDVVCVLDENCGGIKIDGVDVLPIGAVLDISPNSYEFVLVAAESLSDSIEMEVALRTCGVPENKILLMDCQNAHIAQMAQTIDRIERVINTKILPRMYLQPPKPAVRGTLDLGGFGYKVYSQNNEDGVINEIFKRIGTTNKTFVEFGIQDGLECNSHWLLFNGWRGLWIDGCEEFIKKCREHFAKPLAAKQLTLINAFITAENINDLIGGVAKEWQDMGGGGGRFIEYRHRWERLSRMASDNLHFAKGRCD